MYVQPRSVSTLLLRVLETGERPVCPDVPILRVFLPSQAQAGSALTDPLKLPHAEGGALATCTASVAVYLPAKELQLKKQGL